MKEITSINNEYIKSLLKLKEKKYRTEQKKFLIEGFHLVNEAYNAHCLETILVIDENVYNQYDGVEVIKVNSNVLKKLSSTTSPQEIIGVCGYKSSNVIKGDKILLLDNINDPGNLGTLIRSGLGFNIDTILLGLDCVDLYNDKVIRATQGAIFKINIVIKDIKESINYLKNNNNNIPIIGTSLQSSIDLRSIEIKNQYALILGNEAQGVKKELLKETNINVKIITNPALESLNVAVAGSIIMYYLNK